MSLPAYLPGRYLGRVNGLPVLSETKTGKPQLQITLTILSQRDDAAGEIHAVQGPDRTVYLTLTQATLGTAQQPGWVTQLLAGLGWRGESFGAMHFLDGMELEVEMRHEVYEGQTQERWSIWQKRVADPKQVQSVDAQFAALRRSLAQPAPRPQPAPRDQPQRRGADREVQTVGHADVGPIPAGLHPGAPQRAPVDRTGQYHIPTPPGGGDVPF